MLHVAARAGAPTKVIDFIVAATDGDFSANDNLGGGGGGKGGGGKCGGGGSGGSGSGGGGGGGGKVGGGGGGGGGKGSGGSGGGGRSRALSGGPKGPMVGWKDVWGRTPLHWAAVNGWARYHPRQSTTRHGHFQNHCNIQP